MTDNVYTVTVDAFKVLTDKIAKIRKRAEKKNLSGSFAAEVIGECDVSIPVRIRAVDGTYKTGKIDVPGYQVKITGDAPEIPGFLLRSIVQFDNATSVVSRVNSGDTAIPKEFDEIDWHRCDHCGVRHRRVNVFILENTVDGGFVQIGKSCLADYLPKQTVASLINWAMSIHNLEDSANDCLNEIELGYSTGPSCFYTEHYLTAVAATIRKHGWLPKSKCDDPAESTAMRAFVAMLDNRANVSGDDAEMAQNALEWARTMTASGNDYLMTCQSIAESKYVSLKHIGYAASIVSSYQRHIAQQREQEKRSESGNAGQYIGKLKQRLEFSGVVQSVRSFEGYYGMTYLHTILTDDGITVVGFFTSKYASEGDRVAFKATVKDHKEYRGVKQTVVNRPKFA